MFDDPGTGVVIADGRSGLRLSRVREANEAGYPTLIEVRAGPFTGTVMDETVWDYATFLEQLEALYATLAGTATLGSYEGFNLSLVGARGDIHVSAVVIGQHIPAIKLTFEFALDQSYLPPIIKGVRREFPPSTLSSKPAPVPERADGTDISASERPPRAV